VSEDDYPIVQSDLSGRFTRDGVTVEVHIYRGEDEPKWVLEVVDEQDGSTVWDDLFPTDQSAFEEFKRTVETEGMQVFLANVDRRLH
jgi:hypothetical protein